MKNRLDNILLGLLWLLAATLATSFWFNSIYGFNIFSVQHWQYLSHLQARQAPVMPSFYISMGVAVFLTIGGMYIFLQPKSKNTTLPVPREKPAESPKTTIPTPKTNTAIPAPTLAKSAEITQTQTTSQPSAPTQQIPIMRPPKLNIPSAMLNQPTATTTTPAITNTAPTIAQTRQPQSNNESPELRELFTNLGYAVKESPFIKGFKPSLLAVGSNEVLWIGGIDTDTKTLQNAIDELNTIFTDVLEDIYIDVHGFIVNATDTPQSETSNILMFKSISDVSEYMQSHPNPVPENAEEFEAYSTFIDTVVQNI